MFAKRVASGRETYGGMPKDPPHAAIAVGRLAYRVREQETVPRRLRRPTETVHPSGAQKVCTNSVGLPSPHKQPKETCPRLIWPF